MADGIIKNLVSERGFGFILTEGFSYDIFFHHSEVVDGFSFTAFRLGEKVCFELRDSRKKLGQKEAYAVRPHGATPQNSQGATRSSIPSERGRASGDDLQRNSCGTSNPGSSSGQSRTKSSDNQKILPYGFIPIDPKQTVTDTPIWHDGKGGDELLSGEVLCTLKALTPLLPGNARYPVRKDGKEDGEEMVSKEIMEVLRKMGGGEPKPGKQVAEPLRLDGGRVVIAGSALKGMIRHSLSALLSAPMERVAERHFTYRPNFGHGGDQSKRECRPAIVRSVQGEQVEVDVLPESLCAVFLHGGAENKFTAYKPGDSLKGNYPDLDFGVLKSEKRIDTATGQKTIVKTFKHDDHRLSPRKGKSASLDHIYLSYRGGIDGQGELATAFNPHSRTHKEALVPASAVAKVCRKTVPPEVVRQYVLTNKILADDIKGHLSHSHPLASKLKEPGINKAKKGIKAAKDLQPNQLIYVEIEVDKGKLGEILSIGHHYQYRWAYTSSIRKSNDHDRPCLTPTEDERQAGKPKTLTGARLLFGYVHDKENPIGGGVYKRLAGRVAFNHAVSVGVPEFLGKEEHYCIPLKILGQPKASAWEFYLQQDKATKTAPKTYGDLPGDAGGELAGRKFYRHPPRRPKEEDISDRKPETARSDQATLARFICKEETEFRFTIRFAGLREWELGALLAALEPSRLAKAGAHAPTKNYAHKLGLGRPLGLGSVAVKVDRLLTRKGTDHELRADPENEQRAITALKEKQTDTTLIGDWLLCHEHPGRAELAYPLAETRVDGRVVETVYAWHTEIRREYSKLRRQLEPDWSGLRTKMNEQLDPS